MDNSFQAYEIRIIEKELSRKSFSDIAFLLDRSAAEVRAFVSEHRSVFDGHIFQYDLDGKKQSRKPAARPADKPAKEKKRVIESRLITPTRSSAPPKPARRKAYETKTVDLAGCTSVRVDSKTIVYGRKGETEAQILARYKANQATYKLSKAEK